MLLYKYKSLATTKSKDYAFESLKEKYLYFSRPSELNDPFDCQIQISFIASDKEYLEWLKSKRKKKNLGKKLSTVAKIKESIQDPNLLKFLRAEATKMVELNHICSLTPDCFNESMWALYTTNYNGICIGYNVSNTNNYKNIEFSSKYHLDSFQSNPELLAFKQIYYDNLGDHPLPLFKSDKVQEDNILYNLIHKKKCWNAEQEYRAILHDTDFYRPPRFISTTKVFYSDDLLKEIIFGYNVSNDDINYIKQIIKENYSSNVEFFKIKPDLQEYKLIKEQI